MNKILHIAQPSSSKPNLTMLIALDQWHESNNILQKHKHKQIDQSLLVLTIRLNYFVPGTIKVITYLVAAYLKSVADRIFNWKQV